MKIRRAIIELIGAALEKTGRDAVNMTLSGMGKNGVVSLQFGRRTYGPIIVNEGGWTETPESPEEAADLFLKLIGVTDADSD